MLAACAVFRERTWGNRRDLLPDGQNAAQTLRVCRRNHGLRRGPRTVKAVRDLIHKFEETRCTCDRPQSGRPSVETLTEVHQTIA